MSVRVSRLIAALSFAVGVNSPAGGQTEASLKSFFEGKKVVVKMDLPGDKSGIDLYPASPRVLDYFEVGDRLRKYGVALHKGEAVMVTLVKVKNENIEFQLGGGGARDVSAPYISTHVPKSSREKYLEDAYRKETDAERKKGLKADLDDERRRRRYEQDRRRVDAEQARQLAEAKERDVRARGGSRFNLWYEDGVPDEVLTPTSLMRILGDYLAFPFHQEPGATLAPSPALANPLLLRKGMSEREVSALFGDPVSRIVEDSRGIDILWCEYDLDSARLSVQFVSGSLVHYVVSSR